MQNWCEASDQLNRLRVVLLERLLANNTAIRASPKLNQSYLCNGHLGYDLWIISRSSQFNSTAVFNTMDPCDDKAYCIT